MLREIVNEEISPKGTDFWITQDERIINVISAKDKLARDLTDNRTFGYTDDYLLRKIDLKELKKYKVYNSNGKPRYATGEIKKQYFKK